MRTIILLSIVLITLGAMAQERQERRLQEGWKFAEGSHPGAQEVDFDDALWEHVSVPHDWAIAGPFDDNGDANTGKLPWKGEGWYRRTLSVSEEMTGKRLYLIFDGVMAFPKVYMNGKLAGEWDYGYNSFYVDITDFVKVGDNTIAVHADTRKFSSRWYPGAGIYRKVRLLSVNPVHVAVWGTQITVPVLKPNYADVRVRTRINNYSPAPKSIRVVNRIINASGVQVAAQTVERTIKSSINQLVEMDLTMSRPHRWDVADPYLYRCETNIYEGDLLLDSYETKFGIRDIRLTADHGLFLNGRHVQLKGVNLHHDHGPLGAAFNRRAMERQLEIMKEMGCNAIRTSHNIPAPELLELCDEMGLLVFHEFFDKYDSKAGYLEENGSFEDFADRNIRNAMERDRNHPCIFIWSVGNEIHDVQKNENNGFQKLQTTVNLTRKYDLTRPVTLVNNITGTAKLRHFDYYDVHCWNYGRGYIPARSLEPNKPVIISESASTVSTRGFYELPLPEQKTDFTMSLQVSSYDLNAPFWAEIPDMDFMWQEKDAYVAGEFVWTGFDYLGEPTPYHTKWKDKNGYPDSLTSRSSYFGIVDLCGIPKDRYYLYKSYWNPDETTVHILPHWNWPGREGKTLPVFVYTNGDCAELFVNGKSQGMRCKAPKSEEAAERFRLMWDEVVYEPGALKAVAYREGVKIGERTMKTAGKPYRLRLTPDRQLIEANGNDLSYVLVEALDREGNPCPLADHRLTIDVEGAGKLAGVGNGNPQSMNSFASDQVNLFYGKAMIILKAGFDPGRMSLRVDSPHLKPASVKIETQ